MDTLLERSDVCFPLTMWDAVDFPQDEVIVNHSSYNTDKLGKVAIVFNFKFKLKCLYVIHRPSSFSQQCSAAGAKSSSL